MKEIIKAGYFAPLSVMLYLKGMNHIDLSWYLTILIGLTPQIAMGFAGALQVIGESIFFILANRRKNE